MALSIAERLMHSTVRIETLDEDGQRSSGTGFFYAFDVDETSYFPVLITNKHVVEGATEGDFVFTLKDESGGPDIGNTIDVYLENCENHFIKHPDPLIDIAVLPIGGILNKNIASEILVYFEPLHKGLMPDTNFLNSLTGIETITMLGYPQGLEDAHNNLPIIRQGITATSPKFDYDGKSEFLIDCACFPGSSGSPVLIFDEGSWVDKKSGSMNIGGHRLKFLGLLHSGPFISSEGEIFKSLNMPVTDRYAKASELMINLGYVVKSENILDMEQIFTNLKDSRFRVNLQNELLLTRA